MTQPEKTASHRGTRPELFGAARAPRSRHPDFGPSILATIDGAPRRASRAHDGEPVKRVLLLAVLALGVVAVYFGVRPAATQSPASPQPAPISVALSELADTQAGKTAQASEPTPAVPPSPSAAGVASIENVPAPAVRAAASGADDGRVAASLNNIQQVLDRTEASESRKTEKPLRSTKEFKPAGSRAPTPASGTARGSAKPTADSDADLLAAMLPHLKRRHSVPNSPAYEQRCGQLSGNATLECRASFCIGREGSDLACPTAKAP